MCSRGSEDWRGGDGGPWRNVRPVPNKGHSDQTGVLLTHVAASFTTSSSPLFRGGGLSLEGLGPLGDSAECHVCITNRATRLRTRDLSLQTCRQGLRGGALVPSSGSGWQCGHLGLSLATPDSGAAPGAAGQMMRAGTPLSLLTRTAGQPPWHQQRCQKCRRDPPTPQDSILSPGLPPCPVAIPPGAMKDVPLNPGHHAESLRLPPTPILNLSSRRKT